MTAIRFLFRFTMNAVHQIMPVIAFFAFTALAAGRDPLVRVEPPSPTIEAPWQQVRGEQLSFLERLNEEWGIAVTIEHKDQLAIEKSPNLVTFSMSWVDMSKFKVAFGIRTPENPRNERASFSFAGTFSGTEPTETTTKGEWESNGVKLSSALTSDDQRGLGYEFGGAITRAFVTLRGDFKSKAPELVSYAAEVSLAKLYNFVQGVTGASDRASNIKVKIDTERFVRRFAQEVPHFVDLASPSAREAANTVKIQFNPILLVAASTDDVSLWSRQKAVVSVRQALQEELPKGVKIAFNDNLLSELLHKGNPIENRVGMIRLADALEQTTEPEVRAKLVGAYIRELKTGYQAGRQTRTPGALTLVSLRALVTAAEPYAETWNDLPAELRTPGGVARVVGYQLDQAHDDVLLIGEVIPGAPALTIDDLVVGVRTVWQENATPFVSLDPDPADIGGKQHVRVGGVPTDSGFALVMLDADYLMKRMAAGLVPVESPGYQSYISLLRHEIEQGGTGEGDNRFWFYPSPLQTGDIELSPDGTIVLFNTGVQVLSEQMVFSHEGILGTGNVDATSDQWAAGLTKALPDLETRHAEFQHLHGLFDLVLLAKIWQRLKVDSPWIARLAALPYQKVKLPSVYNGIQVKVLEDQEKEYFLFGGVNVRTAANPRAWLVADQPALAAVRTAAADRVGTLVRPVLGRVVLPAGSRRQGSTLDVAAVLALLRRGDTARASIELQKLIEADPFDPEPRGLRAMIDLQLLAYEAALANAKHALDLDPDNPNTVLLASIVRFQAHYLTGRTDAALSDIELAIQQLPDSPRARILKGDALFELERIPEARAEYRKALQLDPQSVMANVSFGLLEISQGWVVRGKKLVEKAQLQMKVEADVPSVKAALAIAEFGVAVLGDAEVHLTAARQYAVEVLDNPASDPLSRIRALNVQTLLALGRDDLPAADGFVQQALNLAPFNLGPLLLMVNWAHDLKRDDVARRYLARAEKIAPEFPAVRKFRRLLGATP